MSVLVLGPVEDHTSPHKESQERWVLAGLVDALFSCLLCNWTKST